MNCENCGAGRQDIVRCRYCGTLWERERKGNDVQILTNKTLPVNRSHSEVTMIGWNGSLDVPTQHDIYDKVEPLSDG